MDLAYGYPGGSEHKGSALSYLMVSNLVSALDPVEQGASGLAVLIHFTHLCLGWISSFVGVWRISWELVYIIYYWDNSWCLAPFVSTDQSASALWCDVTQNVLLRVWLCWICTLNSYDLSLSPMTFCLQNHFQSTFGECARHPFWAKFNVHICDGVQLLREAIMKIVHSFRLTVKHLV